MLDQANIPVPALDRLHSLDGVDALGFAVAQWLARHDAEHADMLALTGALLSRERARGHSGIVLAHWADQPFPNTDGPLRLPALEEWAVGLEASPLVGVPGDRLPLVLDGRRLHFYRYWHAEQRVAQRIAARLAPLEPPKPSTSTIETFQLLFPHATDTAEIDWQAVAAAVALQQRLCLIAGGPGTGKTTTVARILALFLTEEPRLRIGLTAPTGKAAQQLGASIAAQRESLPVDPAVREQIPTEASTIHRLLGYSPSTGKFTYGSNRPLPVDLLVVDESSMIDLLLFDALFDALPSDARLILLGDPNQLASVETGFVFGDLCAAGDLEGIGLHAAAFAAELGMKGVPQDESSTGALSDAVVRLRKVYRFSAGSGIAALAETIRNGDAKRATAVLTNPSYADLTWLPGDELADTILEMLGPYARSMCEAESPAKALQLSNTVRLLSPTHWGSRGIRAVNARLESWLLQQGLRTNNPYFRGRPILITANDYNIGLFNGDVGLCWPADGRDSAWFPDGAGGLRAVPVAQLPAHGSSYAMTVHKSQGSEFDHVVLLLPSVPVEVLTRELLYTAVTRARARLTIVGDPHCVAYAVEHPHRRESGVVDKIVSLLM